MALPKTYGLTHVSVAVNDLDRAFRFYHDVFDMEIMYREEDFIQLTTPGSHDVIVFTKGENDHIGHSGGINHFGFRLRDPADIHEIIRKAIDGGAHIISQGEFVPGSTYVFFTDPDGYEVEVWYE